MKICEKCGGSGYRDCGVNKCDYCYYGESYEEDDDDVYEYEEDDEQ